MNETKFEYFIHYRPQKGESIEMRHAVVTERMTQLRPPLSWHGLSIPAAPDIEEGLTTYYEVLYPVAGLWLIGNYIYRGLPLSPTDGIANDDKIRIVFSSTNKNIDYRKMIHEDLAAATMAFDGYLGRGFFSNYVGRYAKLHETLLKRLKMIPGIDLNGSNNILTLQPVQYWNSGVCQRALGYGRDEVIRRLTGKVPLVQPLMDGVYVVFNDNPDLTFEEFCAYNDRLKPVLGLV